MNAGALSQRTESFEMFRVSRAHQLNLGEPDIAFALSLWGWSCAAAAFVLGDPCAAHGGRETRPSAVPEVRELFTESPALKESVGCWPLAIIT
jgi:hypothetical protein